MSESAVSAKRGWGSFGAKAAQSETPVRAAAKRRPPGRGRSEEKMRSLHRRLKWKYRFVYVLDTVELDVEVLCQFTSNMELY